MSAPSSIGRCRYGEQNVLSTTTSAPLACASSEHAGMSVRVIIGFVGVSRNRIFVFARIAARIALTFDVST